jgi:hypothetical protein
VLGSVESPVQVTGEEIDGVPFVIPVDGKVGGAILRIDGRAPVVNKLIL